MSVYSTIELTETEAVEKIAEHLGIDLEYNGLKRTRQQLLAIILFEITSRNIFSPNYFNNYIVKK